jgi:hypothetical protein
MTMTQPTDDRRAEIDRDLSVILKRFDKIGFGRNGVLDAERTILDWDRTLDKPGRAALRAAVFALIEGDAAEAAAKPLQYNTREKVQAVALTLCGTLPVRDSLPRLQALAKDGAFKGEDEAVCADALRGALGVLEYEG